MLKEINKRIEKQKSIFNIGTLNHFDKPEYYQGLVGQLLKNFAISILEAHQNRLKIIMTDPDDYLRGQLLDLERELQTTIKNLKENNEKSI